MSLDALGYLDEVLDHLQRHSVRREAVDWAELRREARALAGDARSTAETYPAIELALERLGDSHSFFLAPEQVRLLGEGRARTTGLTVVLPEGVVAKVLPDSPAARAGVREGDVIERINGAPPTGMDRARLRAALRAPTVELRIARPGATRRLAVTLHPAACPLATDPRARRLAPGIAYLELPEMSGTADQAAAYAAAAQRRIRELDRGDTRGWVVDLRRNGGGNMWPMLAGIGPLAGEGALGSFVYPDRVERWGYRAGRAFLGRQAMALVDDPYAPGHPPPVAVLTSRLTASSGEFVLLAFRGRPRARSFGEPTAGKPTANDDVILRDGAGLLLTAALGADRTGRAYDGAVVPDQLVAADWTRLGGPGDPVLHAALGWLREQLEMA